MTYQDDYKLPMEYLEQLSEQGTEYLPERLNQEIKRRTRVVGIFPNEAACLRLISAFLMEKSEAWLIGHMYLSFEGSETTVSSSSPS